MRPLDVSLVVPVRDEAGNIGPLVAEIRERLDAAGLSWEAFLVDDGSADGSWAEIVEAAAADNRVAGERHDTGLGKSAALMTGFRRCRGRHVVMLDGDGQDDPAEIPRMVRMLDADPAIGLVNGWKTPRLDPWHKTLPSRVFNLLVGWVTGLDLHDHNCGLKAIRGDVARRLDLATDMHRFIPTLVSLDGHGVVEVAVHHRPRMRGVSKYGMGRFFRGLADLGRVAAMITAIPEAGDAEARRRLRWGVYAILASVALGGIVGRIAAVASVDRIALENRLVEEAVKRDAAAGGPLDAAAVRARIEREKRLVRPFLSGNDRSRWLTVRALVERGTFAIEDLVVEPGWDTIDAVVHPDAAGKLHLYSSKPPLLSVIAAAPYWLIHRLTGWTLGDHLFEVGRLLLLVCGAVPFAIMLAFTLRAADTVGSSDWGRVWAAALAACGTLLTTFAVVLTNHLPAAAAAAASLWLVLAIRAGSHRSAWLFFAAGLAAALVAAFELPALAWLVAVLVVLARCDLRRTLTAAAPAALLVTAAALAANHLAHGTIVPPYAHRTDGLQPAVATATEESWNPHNWYDYAIRLPDGRLLQSYWRSPQGIDRGEPSRAVYAWHAIAGHHGILALTPAWLLVVPGLALLVARRHRRRDSGEADVAMAIAAVSAVVITFYLLRPQADRNYGGMSSGFRWVFWMAPLWVVAAVPAADILGRSRSGRVLACLLLAISVLSVAYPTWNPWTRPWIEQALRHAGWLVTP
ncbi:MAG: glycosyltransferase family 2 protein [Planctomycetes bacterium]|nr:glycosyltransferase family 2 protein [Planctomycetota bacterium]